jgi:tetratricopeptide (TPR) repeat protein
LAELAVKLVTFPDPAMHNPPLAVELGERAIQLSPEYAPAWTCLGISYYRAGEYNAARRAFAQAIERLGRPKSYQLFFQAMMEQRSGNSDKARQLYDDGLKWMTKWQPNNRHLHRYAAEAAELLGLPRPATQPSTSPTTQQAGILPTGG